MNCELVEVSYLLSCLFMDPAYVLVDVRLRLLESSLLFMV